MNFYHENNLKFNYLLDKIMFRLLTYKKNYSRCLNMIQEVCINQWTSTSKIICPRYPQQMKNDFGYNIQIITSLKGNAFLYDTYKEGTRISGMLVQKPGCF